MRIRLIPDSLLGRTALLLVAALAVALGAALLALADQRSEALAALGGRNAAERVAAMVNLLDATPPEARRATLRSMDTPGFRAGWGVNPVVPTGSDHHGLGAAVARQLGQNLAGRDIRVSILPVPSRKAILDLVALYINFLPAGCL